jgi:hypothetical protein
MYDNQMSVFSQQMECEPKLQECNKKIDNLKVQVTRSPVHAAPLTRRELASSKPETPSFFKSHTSPLFPIHLPSAYQVHGV